MTIKEAMSERHMVRKYTNQQIPVDILEKLRQRVQQNNEKNRLEIKLITDDENAIPGIMKLILAKGVSNYFLMAGPEGADEKLGYCGADLMLYAQTLGLNTWWVGGTFSRKNTAAQADGSKVVGIIAVGYGRTQGVPHKSKKAADVSSYEGEKPGWFEDGVNAALLAPTALNKQAFIIWGKGDKVSITCDNGIFTGVDLGLVKYHFETGAAAENFEWF